MDGLTTTESGLIVPADSVQLPEFKDSSTETAKDDLTKHFAAMAKLEQHFPQLVKLAIEVAQRTIKMAKRHNCGEECVMFDTPRWLPNGQMIVRIGLDPGAKRIITNEKAAKNFTNLRALNESVPQAVDLVMAIAFHLVPAVNAKKLDPKSIQIGKPRFNPDDTEMVFSVGMPRPEVDL